MAFSYYFRKKSAIVDVWQDHKYALWFYIVFLRLILSKCESESCTVQLCISKSIHLLLGLSKE